MSLTLNQFLLLVITIAIVVAVCFLIAFLHQMRKTAAEGEKTLVEYRELAKNLQALERSLKDRLEDLGSTLEAAKSTAVSVSQVALFLSTRVVKPAQKWWPLLFPVLSSLWRRWKKRKEE